MKFAMLLLGLLGSCVCVPYGGVVNTGHSAQFRHDDGHGHYEFGYNEDHATGGTFRKEKGGPGYQVGSYGLRDADGRMRIVHYIADAHGFRATISTNEPGVDVNQDPAATSLTSAHGPALESHALAPVALSHKASHYAEPVYASAPVHAAPVHATPMHSDVLPLHSQPLHHDALYTAPTHSEPLFGQRLNYDLGKVTYGPAESSYGALSGALMADAYGGVPAPILKSAYVPDDGYSSEYAAGAGLGHSSGHYAAGSDLYGKQYGSYY